MNRYSLSTRGLTLAVGDWQLGVSLEPAPVPPAAAHELTHVIQQGATQAAVARVWLQRAARPGPSAAGVHAVKLDTITARSATRPPAHSGVTAHGWDYAAKQQVGGAAGAWIPEVGDEVLVAFGSGDPRAAHAALLAHPGALPRAGAHALVELGAAARSGFRLRVLKRGNGALSLAVLTASDPALTRDLRQRRLL